MFKSLKAEKKIITLLESYFSSVFCQGPHPRALAKHSSVPEALQMHIQSDLDKPYELEEEQLGVKTMAKFLSLKPKRMKGNDQSETFGGWGAIKLIAGSRIR